MLISITAEYVSKLLFIMEISVITGVLIFIWENRIQRKKLYFLIFGGAVLFFGLIPARLLYTYDIPQIINLLFVFKCLCFFSFIYLYTERFGIPKISLNIISLSAIPHIISFLIGYPSKPGGFSSWVGDPNYLSVSLIGCFVATLFILSDIKSYSKSKYSFIYYVIFIFIILMLLRTYSRTALMAVALATVMFLYFFYRENKTKSLFYLLLFSLVIFILVSATPLLDTIMNSKVVIKIMDRFGSTGGGSLLENERYIAWALAFDAIIDTGFYIPYGRDAFIKNLYHFAAHNVFLDIGLRMGSYTFFAYILVSFIGIISWLKKILFINDDKKEVFLFVLCCSNIFMMNSISVSDMYYFQFLIYMFFIRIFTINKVNLV